MIDKPRPWNFSKSPKENPDPNVEMLDTHLPLDTRITQRLRRDFAATMPNVSAKVVGEKGSVMPTITVAISNEGKEIARVTVPALNDGMTIMNISEKAQVFLGGKSNKN